MNQHLQLELDNQANWDLVVNESKTAVSESEYYFWPIPPFLLNYSFSRRIISTQISVTNVPPKWKFAGEFEQYNGEYLCVSKPLKLNVKNLLILPLYQSSYQIKYCPPRWFQTVNLKVWQYNGVENDEIISRLINIQSSF